MKKSLGIYLRCFLILFFLFTASFSYAQTIINKYAAVFSYQGCDNNLTVDATTGFAVGDTVLLIQMKGAIIDTTNTPNFGNVLSYNGCGNYEYNVINAINGNNISLVYNIVRDYDIPFGKVQLVSVPSFQNYTVNQAHTCMAWNGTKGGVFAINVVNQLTLNDTINVTGKGFKGGKSDQNPVLRSSACVSYSIDYCMSPNFEKASNKGEGITVLSIDKSFSIGKAANGGGSGFSQNSGGGGGSNGNIGGRGGSEYAGCNNNPANNLKGGIGGLQLSYSNLDNKVFLGGGGGSGHVNNINLSNGGNGGGICIISAGTIMGNNKSILANGDNGLQCINNSSFGSCHDGMAGGGGGGVVMLNVNNYNGPVNIETKGGQGADENGWSGYFQVGPGGGGGGGIVWHKLTTLPGNVSTTLTGGNNGIVVYNGQSWGAQPGGAGQTINNLIYINPVDTFNNDNIISDFSFNRASCFNFSFTNLSTVIAGTITGYSWDFGDGSSSSPQQNPVHTFPAYGLYTVTLTVSASNGCAESVSHVVNIPYTHFLSTSDDTAICMKAMVQMYAYGGSSYTWSPVTGLNNNSIANPVASVTNSIVYFVTAADSLGCLNHDSVIITYHAPFDAVITPNEASICGTGSVQLNVTGLDNPVWVPSLGLNDPNIINPIASPAQTTTYIVSGINEDGCEGTDTLTVNVYPEANVIAKSNEDTINCTNPYVRLAATGAETYYWTPFAILDDPTKADPIAKLNETTTFTVVGTDIHGCKDADTITVAYGENKVYFIPNSFSPNGDGINDIFIPKYFCNFLIRSFQVYNRFGQRVFSTIDPNKGWNGLQNDKVADIGTYFWYIEGKTITNQTIIRKGDVTLIR
jgi:gliding motility-associated-like protein